MIGILLALIIIAGIIVTAIWGFNFGFLYSPHKELDIYIGQEFEKEEILSIAKEVVGNQKIVIQKVELYEDMVSIGMKDITEEQLEQLNTKINEKYGIENTVEDIIITEVSHARGRDLVKPYIMPIFISFAVVIAYLIIYIAIYNHMGKTIPMAKTIGISVVVIFVVQLLYFAILALTRLPITRFTLPIAIVLYIVTTIGIMLRLEKHS